MLNINIDRAFKAPDFIKRSSRYCPECGALLFIVSDKEVCGKCDLNKKQEEDQNKIEQHYKGGNPLEDYNQAKAEKARAAAAKKKERFKDRQYKD